jgi:glutamyl-Q tRNA(Asp) synthetase
MQGFTTRFAPSPTGYLHLGHAFSALTAYAAAHSASGTFLLRVEDIDTTRCRPAFEAAIFEDLAWLGLTWPAPVLRQSERMDRYAQALQALADRGLVYRCFKTRKELLAESANAPHGATEVLRSGPLPPSLEEERLEQSTPFAWRLSLSSAEAALGPRWKALRFHADGQWIAADPQRLGDVIVARKDVPTSYHLASVLDDAAQGVTHIVRGEDLREAPHIQVLLQALLDLPTPTYTHHRLILGPDGQRLAKRDQATTLRQLREAGETPASLRRQLGFPTL